MRLPHPHRFARFLFLGLALGFALASFGCSGSQATPAKSASAEGASDAETFYKERLASAEVSDLLDELERDILDTKAASTQRPVRVFEDNTPPPKANLTKSYEVEQPTTNYAGGLDHANTGAAVSAYDAHPADPDELKAELVREIAELLRDEANSPDWPVPALVRLAAMDLVEPGTFNSYYLGDGSGGMTNLHPRDVQVLSAWRDLFRNARQEFNSQGENADIAAIAQQFADQLTRQHALRVPAAKLCTKVDGFGLYTALPDYDGTYKLLAGRRHRLIVYVEVDRFSHTEAVQDGRKGFAVDLTQDLSLYHSGDREDTLAWRKPNQAINDWSLNKRRDFFVVQIIDLPETLTIGSYRLKVRMTDDGADPPAEAEATVEIEVVADTSAFRR